MGLKKWFGLALAAPLLLVGCKGFWDPIGSSDFTLSNSGTITVSSAGATSGNTSTITVTPSSSFTGTVALTCAITTSPSSASSPVTCSLSPTSLTFSSTTAQTATLTATTTSATTTGTYEITVTGTSGSATTTTTACVIVGTSSGNCSSSASNSGNFYVLDAETKQIAGYNVNAGTLTPLSGSPYTVPATPTSPNGAMAIAPNGAFLYVGTAAGIYVYSIASNGSLSLGNSSGIISPDQAVSMQVSANNNWLVEAAPGYVYAVAINSSNGTIASKTEQPLALSGNVQQVAISPDSSYVFVAMGTGGTEAIAFNAGAAADTDPFGATTHISTVNAGGAALSVAVDPLQSGQTAPRLFYIGETVATSGSNSGGLRAFDFSTLGGTLTEITGSPFPSQGLAPYSILPISTGNYVYVANRQTSSGSAGVIAGFSIASSNSTYSLTALGSDFAAGTNPVALAEDSTGTYVFAVDYGGSPDLMGYTFSSTNAGYLTSGISSATGTDPVQASAIVAAP